MVRRATKAGCFATSIQCSIGEFSVRCFDRRSVRCLRVCISCVCVCVVRQTGTMLRSLSPKNKQLLAICFCALLSLPTATHGRKVAVSRVTKPTAHRGYANADIAKLSYSPSHAAAPKLAAAAPAPVYSSPPGGSPQRAPGGQPPSYGWNVPGAGQHGAAGAGGVPYPGAAAAGAAGTGLVASNVYRSHGHNATGGGFGGGLAHSPPGALPSYPVQPAQGFPGAPVQHPGGGFPAQGYQPQYVPQQQGGFPHQPSYVPAGGHYDQGGQPHYQGHPGQTVVHHYEQPAASGGSGIGTVLGAGAAGLAAGIGGAALYDALKPKDAKEEPTSTAVAATTTAATTIAGPTPVPAASETPVPLASLPANPNGDAPLAPLAPTEATPLATTPAEGETTATTSTTAPSTVSSENPLGMAPLAPFPDSSPATPGDTTGADVEVRLSSLNAEPDLSASMAEPASGNAASTVHLTSAISLFALLPLLVKYLRC
uniref:Uncharacterized protein n=1 Tax=Anopheles farauti TaxID=69004 RepID=A0A182QVF8_9DIPT